jgi:hypothetical protein
MKNCMKLVIALALLTLPATQLQAQSLFATLTGVVSDPSGAVVPNATVKLINEQSGSTRDTVTNGEGYYSFASVAVGNLTYKVVVSVQGFQTYQATGLAISGGEKRNLNVALTIGAATQTVEVTAAAQLISTLDSGEKSQTLTNRQLTNYVQVGSNAAEFIKIMPGFGINNGTRNMANFSGEVIGINANGDAGSQSPLNNAYSYYGLPSNSLDITADGAHVSDPGCNCDTPVNPNADMVSEFKVSTSYSAENQKGPIVISTVTKAGGSQFHGDAMFSLRNYKLNANDALFDQTGQPKPANKYYYPEGQISGPVLIPGTGFNKNRDKLFFFTAFEYYYQVLDTGLVRATVPTSGMLEGNFSATELAKLGDITAAGAPAQLNPCFTVNPIPSTQDSDGNFICDGTLANAGFPLLTHGGVPPFPDGIIPEMTPGVPGSGYDPNMIALMKLYPAPNADPNGAGTKPYNYVQAMTFNQNNREWKTRVDYNISDNTKLFVRYSYQREVQQFPVGLWWRASDTQVPYPTPVLGKNRSDSVSASLTHVFSPTMTNEFVFAYTFIGFDNVFEDPKKVDRTVVGYNYQGLFKNGVTQIPAYGSIYGGGDAAVIHNPGGFEAGGPTAGLYANKYMPSVSDTFAKVAGKHTIKAGFFWEWIRNAQPANNYTNGLQAFGAWNPQTVGKAYADMALGILGVYWETNFNRINDIAYHTWEGFAQDDWKATKRLTINYGLRATHFQPWVDRLGFGYSIFDQSLYTDQSCTGAPTFCGFDWHKKDSSVPAGGFPSRALFYQPRLGVAYDLFGNGKTVLRGSWGRYYFHSGLLWAGLDASAGVVTTGICCEVSYNGQTVPLYAALLDDLDVAGVASSPSAVDSKDDLQAHTDFYNFTISQRTPWSGLLELSYIGNRTRDIPGLGNGGSLGVYTLNINKIPKGALWSSNNGGQDPNNLPCDGSLCNGDQFRPLRGYQDLYVDTNNGYSNYNGLQATWLRTKGKYSINLNYTYGKAMGLVYTPDEFNLANDYGVLPSNRTHIFNAAYYIQLPSPVKNKLAAQFVNGWQLSGITQIQSGANLWGNSYGPNFNMNLNSAKIPGTDFDISSSSILGTRNIMLSPLITCDPRKGLGEHQYINPSCFAAPTEVGHNGPTVIPPIYGPTFFNWDMGVFKNFRITESKSIEFRLMGYNWLNHPLWSFYQAGGNNLTLSIDPTTYRNQNPTFGTATDRQGHRIIQMQFKFIF